MPKGKMAKTYPMAKLDDALCEKFNSHNYLTEWNIIQGAYVTTKIVGRLTKQERIFIDGYMAAVNDCMYGGTLK